MRYAIVLVLVCLALSLNEAKKKKKPSMSSAPAAAKCDYSKFDCSKNATFYLNYCNKCDCIENTANVHGCDYNDCNYLPQVDPHKCEVGYGWTQDAHTYCCCMDEIGTACVTS